VANQRAAHARSGLGGGAHVGVESTPRRSAAGRLVAVLAGGALLGGAGFFGLTAGPAFAAANVVVHGTGSKTGTGPGKGDVATATAFHGFAAASAGQGSSTNRDDTATAVADDGVAIAIAG
jgi:hypothetical protein